MDPPDVRAVGRAKARRRTWSVLRSRSLVFADDPGSALRGRRTGARAAPRRRRLGCVSDSGHVSAKLLCFVFEPGCDGTIGRRQGIPRRRGRRLLEEVRASPSIRERLAGAPEAAALPLEPLWTGRMAATEMVVEPPDPPRPRGHEDREAALGWLRRFHAGPPGRAWGTETDLAEVDEMLDFAASPSGVGDAASLSAGWRAAWDEARPRDCRAARSTAISGAATWP